jgi:hypothetical protein
MPPVWRAWLCTLALTPAALDLSLLLLLQPWETAKVSKGVRLQSPDTVRSALQGVQNAQNFSSISQQCSSSQLSAAQIHCAGHAGCAVVNWLML